MKRSTRFIAPILNAADTVELDMIKPKKAARLAPPPGLSKTCTRNTVGALEDEESYSGCSHANATHQLHNAHDERGELDWHMHCAQATNVNSRATKKSTSIGTSSVAYLDAVSMPLDRSNMLREWTPV